MNPPMTSDPATAKVLREVAEAHRRYDALTGDAALPFSTILLERAAALDPQPVAEEPLKRGGHIMLSEWGPTGPLRDVHNLWLENGLYRGGDRDKKFDRLAAAFVTKVKEKIKEGLAPYQAHFDLYEFLDEYLSETAPGDGGRDGGRERRDAATREDAGDEASASGPLTPSNAAPPSTTSPAEDREPDWFCREMVANGRHCSKQCAACTDFVLFGTAIAQPQSPPPRTIEPQADGLKPWCFWPKCSNHKRCEAFGGCVAATQSRIVQLERWLNDAADAIGGADLDCVGKAIRKRLSPPQPTPAKRDWVNCPICGEPDMEKETDAEGCAVITCVNHACASNGGTNASALHREPTPEVAELVNRLRDDTVGAGSQKFRRHEAADALERLSRELHIQDEANEILTRDLEAARASAAEFKGLYADSYKRWKETEAQLADALQRLRIAASLTREGK